MPGAERQRLHHCLHAAPWDSTTLNARRLALWQAHPTLGPHADSVLIVDETGDRKRGHGIVLAAQQWIGKLNSTANGVVSVTSHWADGTRHVPLGVRAYRPAGRLPRGKADPAFHTKPELAWPAKSAPGPTDVRDPLTDRLRPKGAAVRSSPTITPSRTRLSPGSYA